ncbi:MAG: glycogen synthase GlgA [Verrucomicrobia bacterium]|nr:glycogen synthase GlgA [Verrucomicrobiota bacterium]
MADQGHCAFITSEMSPFASTGGLAEVSASLPEAMARRGWSMIQIMPMYRQVIEGNFPLVETGMVLNIPVGFHQFRAEVWRTAPEIQPAKYFIRRDEFFDRAHLYNLSYRDYEDNFERFVFFQKAAVALIDALERPVSLVHCNDWQTALMPLYLQHGVRGQGRGKREKTLLTLHNLAYQGIFSGDEYSYSNLPFGCFSVECLEFYGNINCLKGGINTADFLTTVSQTYAEEIQTEAFGYGLHGVISDARHRLRGITNGIDTQTWDPQTDSALAKNYSVKDPSGKQHCKRALLKLAELSIPDRGPLLGMVTRLSEHKGIDLLDEMIPDLMGSHSDLGLILLGDGDAQYEGMCLRWQSHWPGRIRVMNAFDRVLARQIIAGADLYLMPSRYEPCGLNQLYAMRYGTVPVVHHTGGLADTVTDADNSQTNGNGFVFSDYTVKAFQDAVQRAIRCFDRKAEAWRDLQNRGMAGDYTWDQSAAEYEKIYRQLHQSSS